MEKLNGIDRENPTPASFRRKSTLVKKITVLFDNIVELDQDLIMKHIRLLLNLKEFQFMWEYIKWNVINFKKLLNVEMITHVKETL